MATSEHVRDRHGSGGVARAEPMVAFWALACITWINSLGSGMLWSGVPFITQGKYGFIERENLLLALGEAAIYVGSAFASGPLLRAFQRRGGTARSWLACIFALQIAGSLLTFMGPGGLVAAACVLSAVGALLWPVMESFLSSGRHGHDMRRAIGRFNVVWMSATGASLFVVAPVLASGYGQYALLALVPVSLVSIALLRVFPAQPAAHSAEESSAHVPHTYRALLHGMRFVLPVSYVFIAVIGPILPFRLVELGLDESSKLPLASLWMFARVAVVALLAYLPFWHGRWGAILLGVALLAGGFAAMVVAPNAWVMAGGLVAFGAGHGILYQAALYYAMAAGSAAVDAGGVFEGLIGVGYVVGPLAGLIAAGNAGTLITAVWSVAAVGALPAAWTWMKARSLSARGTAP